MISFPRSSLPHLCGAFVLAVSAAGADSSGADPDWRARFRAEAPAAWENYRQANRYAQGVRRSQSEGGGAPPARHETELKANEACQSVRVTDLTTGASEVFARNPKYWFRLKTGKDGAWTLAELHPGAPPGGTRARDIGRRIDLYFSAAVDGVFRLGIDPEGKLLGEVLHSPRTRVTGMAPARQGGADLVEVRFETTPDPGAQVVLTGGKLLLDPARSWLPVAKTTATRNLVGAGTQTTEYEFGPGSQPLPQRAVSREEYKLANRAEPWRQTTASEYDLRVPERLPDTREFTLSAYGLPEPAGVGWARPTPRYVWFLLAAGAFAVLMLGFRYLARRRRAATAAG